MSTFGCLIRAARMGYHRLPASNAWLRITAAPSHPDCWLNDLLPGDMDPLPSRPAASPKIQHYCWWEVDGVTDPAARDAEAERLILESSAALRDAMPVTRRVALVINDLGELVTTLRVKP